MSAMVESGRSHTPAGGNMHTDSDYNGKSSSSSSVNNLHSVSDLLKDRLVHREDDGAERNSPSHEGVEERVSGADYISHSGSETSRENGVNELTSMVSRHVSMMGGFSNDDNSDSATVLRGMLRGQNGTDKNSMAAANIDSNSTTSTSGNSMIGKLLQRDTQQQQEGSGIESSAAAQRGTHSSYDIDVDGDSMPSTTTPNEFSDDDMSDRSPSAFMEEDEEFNEELNASTGSSSSKSKRARVENIISSMNRSSSPVKETPVTPIDQRRHKRKQYIPQQHDSGRIVLDSEPEPEAKMRKLQEDALQKQMKMMQQQLLSMQQRYTDLYQQQAAAVDGDIDLAEVERRCHQRQMIINGMQEKESKIQELSKRHGLLGPVEIDSSPFVREAQKMVDGKLDMYKTQISPLTGDTPKDLENLAVMLKNEIRHSVGTLVDNVVARFVEETKRVQKEQHSPPQTATVPVVESAATATAAATELPSPAKERPSPPEPAKTPTQPPPPPQPTPVSPQAHPQQQLLHPPPVLSHSIHKITNNNNNNNEIKPITIVPKHNIESAFSPEKQSPLPRIEQPKPTRTKVTDKIIHPFFDHSKPSFADLLRHAPLFPPPPYFHHLPHPMPPMFHHHHPHQPKISNEPEPEQTEALALVVSTPKKKRTKVTDTRLSPRAARALLQEPVPTASHEQGEHSTNQFNGDFNHHPHHHIPHSEPNMLPIHPNLLPTSLPTSVAIPNPSLQHSDIMGNMYGSHMDHPASFPDFGAGRVAISRSPSVRDHGSPSMHPHDYGMFGRNIDSASNDMFDGEPCTNMDGYPMTTTLTPMHLRKAKLIFFFVRYPSSSILKIFFPDIKFNKNNTAQLVKWFSNFREFYYIQMEKYARQALAEGVKNPEDLIVTTDSEIYRVLNLHYNRNNQLEVPESFRVVVQSSLREFYKSIQAGKDSEQSWKKAIYKVISRMDDTIPEYFKSPNWMEMLNDN